MRGERVRFWLPVAALALFAAYTSQKLIRAHINPEVGSIRYEREHHTTAPRGGICDVNGVPLAQSIPVWQYNLDPVALTNRVVKPKGFPRRSKESILRTISQALGLDYARLVKMAETRNKSGWRNQYLAQSGDPVAHKILANSSLVAGIAIDDKQVRNYVHRRRLSHVIGSVNAEGVGSAGIEQRFNGALTGKRGLVRSVYDALGHELYEKRVVLLDPVKGDDVHLTVDHNLQYESETALADGVREFGAAAGWCIVMDSRNAAVLAMASLPDFDPHFFGSVKDAQRLNRAVAFTYEPGSVMKVITAAAAIDAGFTSPGARYSTDRYDSRYYKLPGDGSHVWDPTMTVADAIVHSSNIVIGKLGYDFGPKRLYAAMRRFGFGARTGIELPGEEVGILYDPSRRMWDKATWSRAAIGQSFSVTAIQLCSAYQAIANDGVRMQPHIVSKVVDSSGIVIRTAGEKALGRVISARTAQTMRKVMMGVASPNGTARRAAIRGYTVAGKTGTAQKVVNGRYADGLYRATFCGIVPANEPRLVILVTLDFEARTRYHQGGNSSAPIFRRIATAALRYLMVPPDKPSELDEYADNEEFDRIQEERARRNAAAAIGE